MTHDNRVFVAGGLYVFHKNFSNMIASRSSPDRTNEQDDLRDGNICLLLLPLGLYLSSCLAYRRRTFEQRNARIRLQDQHLD